MKIKAGIIGATGYAGAELVRILLTHPEAEITAISSVSFEGKKLSDVYPSYKSLCDMECKTQDEVVEKSDVIFAALPHGLSQELAAQCDKAGKAFIDLGADFIQFMADNRLHLFPCKGCPLLAIRSGNLVCLPGSFDTVDKLAFDIFCRAEGNVQLFGKRNGNISAADIQNLVINNCVALDADDLCAQITHVDQDGCMIAFLLIQVQHGFAG